MCASARCSAPANTWRSATKPRAPTPVRRSSIFFSAMKILAKMGEFVNRKGFYPPLPDADKIQAVEMDDFDAKGFADKTREYQKLFLK